MIGMVAMTACIFVLFFAVNIEMILVGNLLAVNLLKQDPPEPIKLTALGYSLGNFPSHHHRLCFRDCATRTPRCKFDYFLLFGSTRLTCYSS